MLLYTKSAYDSFYLQYCGRESASVFLVPFKLSTSLPVVGTEKEFQRFPEFCAKI